MKLSKPLLIVTALFVLLVGASFFLGYKITSLSRRSDLGQTPGPTQRPLDINNFTSDNYVVPLESNIESPSEYSSRAQIRGVVGDWQNNMVSVEATGKTFEISVPQQTYIRCMPETIVDSEGKTVETKQIYLDFRNAQSKGTLVQEETIREKISVGDDLTLIVNVDSNENMTADFFVGYGCEI